MPITQVQSTGLLPAPAGLSQAPGTRSGESFSKVIDQLLGNVNQQQNQADQLVRDLAVGKTDNVSDVMLEVAKTDLTFRMILEIRNRLVEGFQEILRLQV